MAGYPLSVGVSLLSLCTRRSTIHGEDLGEVVGFSGHGTWVDEDLDEIGHDVVEVRCPLQTMPKGYEERMTPSEVQR